MKLALTADQIQRARALAKSRNSNKERNGVKSLKRSSMSDEEVHFVGLLGELALAETFGGEINQEVFVGPDDRLDVKFASGISIDVKVRMLAWHQYALWGTDAEKFRADAGVLMFPGRVGDQIASMLVRGWMTRSEFVRHATVVPFGSFHRLAYPNERLRQPSGLQQFLAEPKLHSFPGEQL